MLKMKQSVSRRILINQIIISTKITNPKSSNKFPEWHNCHSGNLLLFHKKY